MAAYVYILILVVVLGLLYLARNRLPGLARWRRVPDAKERLQKLLVELKPAYEEAATAQQLKANPRFVEGVALVAREPRPALLELIAGSNPIASLMAGQALAQQPLDAGLVEAMLKAINHGWFWSRRELLRDLARIAREPVVGPVFAALAPDAGWDTETTLRDALKEFVAARDGHEAPSFGGRLEELPTDRIDHVGTVLASLGADAPRALVDEVQAARRGRIDMNVLKAVGRVVATRGAAPADVVPFEPMADHAAAIHAVAAAADARPVLVTGENGVGKTSVLRLLATRLVDEGWIVFEAGAADLLAGQMYIGQLEGRMQALIRELEGKRVMWIVPEFQELAWAGRHSHQPTGVLDLLLPVLEQRGVHMIGEIRAAAYERLVTQNPRVRTVFQPYRVPPLSEAETVTLARQWSDVITASGAPARVTEQVIRETTLLARQYFPERSAPGGALHLLRLTHSALEAAGLPGRAMISDDVLQTLAQLSGLPLAMLDDREALPIDELREFFARRVLGQKEAVDVLVERVAMIKAGLTDPTRPLGVFLFVGPTGTGKTEIAKALAEFLFGSPERLLRLDMSELQTPDAAARIVGEAGEFTATASLTDGIRKQPFSVILLDEFEKSHSSLWDLFLQVFDDGRLTDRRGNTADFRHAIIIMTSNLGARLPHGASLGFTPGAGEFTTGAVDRAVAATFRREFVNRLDRIVVFRPLDRTVMRELVRKELSQLRERRGLRNREWAIEYDEEVVDLLLEHGFSADLGARPLKRAIERYLLTPLANTIVRHEVPAGDQFLFVRRDGAGLRVQFVDPDAPEESPPASAGAPAAAEDAEVGGSAGDPTRLEALVAEARGAPQEIETLRSRVARLEARQASEGWTARKEEALARMAAPGFWDMNERFEVLGRVEYIDRIKAGLETAGSLLGRLVGDGRSRPRYPEDVVRRLALQVFLLEAACAGLEAGVPWDAFVLVRASDDGDAGDSTGSDVHARSIAGMYMKWAQRRRMHVRLLDETPPGAARSFRWIAAISGYAALTFLAPEAGWHVLEVPEGGSSFQRARAEVRVAPQPWEPQRGDEDWRRAATQALEAVRNVPPAIVRRYRAAPSPLVRDSVRGWRTGRLDRVLAGEFDVMG